MLSGKNLIFDTGYGFLIPEWRQIPIGDGLNRGFHFLAPQS
jgi:hypothetical protein